MSSAPARPSKKIAPYPWAALDRLSREVVTALPAFRRAMRHAVDERALAASLGEVIGAKVGLLAHDIEIVTGPDLPSLHGVAFVLATSNGSARVGVEVDRQLAAMLVAKVTERPVRMMDPSRASSPAITGAVAAILTTALRKARGTHSPLLPLGLGGLRLTPGERVMRFHVTVIVNDEAYAALVTLPWVVPHAAAYAPRAKGELSRLSLLPIELPIIAATAMATRADLADLSEGDAFLAGEGWTIRREGAALVGEVVLGAAASERGLLGALLPDGGIVLGEGSVIPLEATAMQDLESDNDRTAEAVLDAPVIVRVEVGAVTLTAREWALLAPGDVIAVGKRVAEPVVLRVGGLEVARGELVDIEGELGVRIRERRGER